MKNIFVLPFALLGVYVASAQQLTETEIPQAVRAKLASLNPMAKNVKWEKENGNYEAGFKQELTDISILMDEGGIILQTETEIPALSLPNPARDYISKKLSGRHIKEAAKITDAAGIVSYAAEVGDIDYLFDTKGNFIGTETDKNEDKHNND